MISNVLTKRYICVDEINSRLAAFRESWAVTVVTGNETLQSATVDLVCLFDDLAELLTASNEDADKWLDSL